MKEILKTPISNLGDANVSLSVSSVGLLPLLRKALGLNQKHVTNVHEEGSTNKPGDFFLKKITSSGGRLIYHYNNGGKNSDVYDQYFFVWNDGIAEFNFRDGCYFTFEMASLNADLAFKLMDTFQKVVCPPPKKGYVFSIVRYGSNLSLASIGNAGISLNELNYSKDVISQFKEAVVDLNSDSPAGRIIILEGEPGTGKTHLIKSFLTQVPEGMFVLIPPDMLSSLSGPEFLPLLLQHKHSHATKGPIIIVLEDADQCLVARNGDNMNSIQSLLNLGDGIVGSLLDLRIIATTNANKLEMESAILRPGRLSQRIEVAALSKTESIALFKNLVPQAKVPAFGNKNTLAVVYSQARKAGWKPAAKKSQ